MAGARGDARDVMRGRGRWVALSLALAVLFQVGPTLRSVDARAGVVAVHTSYFAPARIAVEPGDTVRWEVVEGGHTITADDATFDFPHDVSNAGVVSPGEVYERAFPRRGVYYYHCKLHGTAGGFPAGMTGAIYVGVPLDGPVGEVRRVPTEYATIGDALRGIPPGSTVMVAPGRYHEAVQSSVGQIAVRGEGASPGEVVIDGEGDAEVGVGLSGDDVTLANLSVEGATSAGVRLSGVSRFLVEDVRVDGAAVGLQVASSSSGGIRRVHARGASIAAMSIGACSTCGVVVEDAVATGSAAGVVIDAAAGVVLRNINATNNQRGIVIAGSQHVDLTASKVSGGDVGIAVTALLQPSQEVRVFDNVVTGYGTHGLEWDLLGVHVCFSGNADPAAADGTPASQPPLLQVLFSCPS